MPKGVPNQRYTPEFKEEVIRTMQEDGLGYLETAERFGIRHKRYAILVDEEFSCLEFYMNRDTISWILKKVGCLSEITAYLF